MTNALYLNDSYLKEFSAKIIKAEGNKIILDQTAFYPEIIGSDQATDPKGLAFQTCSGSASVCGGQLCDFGKLIRNNEEFNITDVRKENDEIVHYTDKEGLKIGDEVKGIIDWDRRYKMMRMHTAAHILSAIINLQTGALITGNQLGLEKSRIDFNLAAFDREAFKDYFASANDAVKWDLPIMVDVYPVDQIINDKKLCKLAKGLPPNLKEVRIVEIEMFDKQADVGTHVKFTKEVGKIEMLDSENKGADNRCIYFKLE